MKKNAFQLLASVALLLFAFLSIQAQDTNAKFDEYLSAITKQDRFSGSVLVARDGKVLFSKGYGMANLEWDIPNTPQTKFRLGSITKQFTAASILLLQERGKLSVKDPICKYVENCPKAWEPVTIHHLLTHTSGIPSYTEVNSPEEFRVMSLQRVTPAGFVDSFKSKPLEFAVGEKMNALGPLVEKLGIGAKGVSWKPEIEIGDLAKRNGVVREGPGAGRPAIKTDIDAAEVILALSGTTNGRIANESFKALGARTGKDLTVISEEHIDQRMNFSDLRIQPRKVHASAEWSGSESRERRYSPFTSNIEHLIPFRTLSGRQSFYVDHAWMLDMGEGLPAYRPPVRSAQVIRRGDERSPDDPLEVAVRYLTPHSKWSIHSEFQDNLHMLTLFRGGPVMWISEKDAERVEVKDNDWLEVYNSHGAVSCRAAVSVRVPEGIALFYHSQDRHVNVPISEVTGQRGGTDNSLTRISMKPTHMIGGYAQLSYGFNYYGPCGTQRDQLIMIRKRQEEVRYQ